MRRGDGANDVTKVLGPLESEVMKVLWDADGPLAVRDVLDRVNADRSPQLAYTTVMTVLSRLADKEILVRRQAGRGFVYVPLVRDAAGIAVRGVLRDFGDAALAKFVDHAKADPKILRRLERLLAEEQ